jgi:large subunit ribosomal protein L19e
MEVRMNLRSKKQLAAKTFGVGKSRIAFVNERMEEIKEAITKQDMRNLQKDGAIIIKEIRGRATNVNKGKRRGIGKVRLKVNTRKRDYVILTRKLRKVIAESKRNGSLKREEIKEIRKKIRNKLFKSKANLKEHLGGFKNENTKTKKKRK